MITKFIITVGILTASAISVATPVNPGIIQSQDLANIVYSYPFQTGSTDGSQLRFNVVGIKAGASTLPTIYLVIVNDGSSLSVKYPIGHGYVKNQPSHGEQPLRFWITESTGSVHHTDVDPTPAISWLIHAENSSVAPPSVEVQH